MHSHLIPAVDDGSTSVENSLDMIRRFADAGYKKLITTPHIMSDFYRNTPEILLPKLELVRQAIKQQQIPIEIDVAAEYYLDYDFEQKINKEKLLTFGANYVLFEVSYVNMPENIDSVIFQLQTQGYRPVLAHPERYPFWYEHFDKYVELKSKGVFLQLNVNSLTGYYSPTAKKIAERMIEENIVDFIGSDCHRMDHTNVMYEARYCPTLLKLIESGKLLNNTL